MKELTETKNKKISDTEILLKCFALITIIPFGFVLLGFVLTFISLR